MKFNINDRARVRLTDEGAALFNESLYKNIPLKAQKAFFLRGMEKKVGDWLDAQIWSIMNIFGPETFLGCPQFFMDNEIQIEEGC